MGLVGVNWKVHIIGCKFLDERGEGDVANAIECIRWCREQGARITSNSWGSDVPVDLSRIAGLYDEMKAAEVRMLWQSGPYGILMQPASEVYPWCRAWMDVTHGFRQEQSTRHSTIWSERRRGVMHDGIQRRVGPCADMHAADD